MIADANVTRRDNVRFLSAEIEERDASTPGVDAFLPSGIWGGLSREKRLSKVTISGLTITNGNGVGILNQGGLTLSNSSVVSNAGVGFDNNPSPRNNGGLATLTITNCTVSGNSGGGIFNTAAGGGGPGGSSAALTVNNCTISRNLASNGGGIYNAASGGVQFGGSATVAISNSTLSGNSATGDGGAIYNSGQTFTLFGGFASASVKNCTISGNSATGHGGGIYNNVTAPSPRPGLAELELGSTILKAGSSGENIFNNGGTVTSLGYNLATDNGGGFLTRPGDQINTNPMLGPLQHNGGPTFTHAYCPAAPPLMLATRASLRRLYMTSAAQASGACATGA